MVIDLKQEQSYDRQEQKLLLKFDSVHFLLISSSNIYLEKNTFLEMNLRNITEIIPNAEMNLRNMKMK